MFCIFCTIECTVDVPFLRHFSIIDLMRLRFDPKSEYIQYSEYFSFNST